MADDPKTPESWTIRHFSQADPKGPGQGDVPALLRRVADSIQGLGAVDIQDVTFGTEITEDGPWHHLTVYFHPEEAATVGEGQRHFGAAPCLSFWGWRARTSS